MFIIPELEEGDSFGSPSCAVRCIGVTTTKLMANKEKLLSRSGAELSCFGHQMPLFCLKSGSVCACLSRTNPEESWGGTATQPVLVHRMRALLLPRLLRPRGNGQTSPVLLSSWAMTRGQVGKGGRGGGGVEKGKRESESSFTHACCHQRKRLCFVGEVLMLSDRFFKL